MPRERFQQLLLLLYFPKVVYRNVDTTPLLSRLAVCIRDMQLEPFDPHFVTAIYQDDVVQTSQSSLMENIAIRPATELDAPSSVKRHPANSFDEGISSGFMGTSIG